MKTKGEVVFSWLTTPDSKYRNGWHVTLLLDRDEAKKLDEVGVPMQIDKETRLDKKKFFRGERKKNGALQQPPIVIVETSEGSGEYELFTGIVGKGSIVEVQHKPYEYSGGTSQETGQSYSAGKNTELEAVRIIKLVEYISPSGDGESDSDGPIKLEFEGVKILEDSTTKDNESKDRAF